MKEKGAMGQTFILKSTGPGISPQLQQQCAETHNKYSRCETLHRQRSGNLGQLMLMELKKCDGMLKAYKRGLVSSVH